jgi:hypothetical protein
MALKYHPDKNGNSFESNEKFKLIHEAYEILKSEINISDENIPDTNEEIKNNEPNNSFNSGYTYLLNLVIEEFLKGKYNDVITTTIKNIINDIINGCKEITLKLFEEMDQEKIIGLYTFLSTYKNILPIKDDILNKIKNIIREKYKDFEFYILNPSLNDLFHNNIYKLEIDNQIYFVPLWHNELYFDNSNEKDDIIVRCIPDLPDNIYIDDDNNIIIEISVLFNFSLLNEKYITTNICNNLFEIPINELFIRQQQIYIFKKRGISKIIENDIYNVDDKSDIIFRINMK